MAHVRRRHKPDCPAHPTNAQGRNARCTRGCPWQARVPDPVRGGTHKIEKTFRLRDQADAWVVAELAAQAGGTWVDPRQAERKFSEAVTEWQGSWTNRVAPTTRVLYEGILNTYLLKQFGSAPIGRIDHGAVQRYVDGLSRPVTEPADKVRPALAPGTVRNVYGVLRSVMNRAVRVGWIKVNPCTNIDLPRPRTEEMEFLTPAEVRTLAEAIDEHYKCLIYTAAYTGLRAGELLALRRKDVDLLRGTITVRQALKDINGRLEFGDVKTQQSRRTVTMAPSIREMLREHLSSALLGGNGPDALVFPSKTGKPIRHGLFYKRHFRPAVAGWDDRDGVHHPGVLEHKAGLRFHDLRHTSASLAIHSGAHPLLVSKMLGHSNVEITLNRYAHLFPDVAEALAEKMDALFVAASEAAPEPENVKAIR